MESLRSGDGEGLGALAQGARMALFFEGELRALPQRAELLGRRVPQQRPADLHGGEPVDAGRFDGAGVVKASPFNAAGRHSDAPDGEAAAADSQPETLLRGVGEFRTPSLRNLSGRAPFMHQGQLADLAAVLEFYSDMAGTTVRGHHQEQFLQPLRLHEDEKAALIAFLGSLNGPPAPQELLEPPSSPRLAPSPRGVPDALSRFPLGVS